MRKLIPLAACLLMLTVPSAAALPAQADISAAPNAQADTFLLPPAASPAPSDSSVIAPADLPAPETDGVQPVPLPSPAITSDLPTPLPAPSLR